MLVVDDEPTIRELAADALREAGYDVAVAANGAEALGLMQHRIPNAVVLDLMMPRVDGGSLVELARADPRLARVPIVVLTAAYGAEDMAERLGARICLTKPFELDALVDAVDRAVDDEPVAPGANGSFTGHYLAHSGEERERFLA